MNKAISNFIGGFLALATVFFGSDSEVIKFVIALIIFMGFDLATGIFKAIYNKNFKAGILENGILKKVMILTAVSFCYFIDKYNILNAGINLESVSSVFFLAGELISTIENFADMGLKLPQQLIDLINKKAGDFIGK